VTGLSSVLLSVAMIAAFALAAGGIVMIRRGRERTKGVLMVVAALVLVGNVLIATL
jgi:hypothetical protein